jgi:trehalose 6-phosphate synthase
MMTDQNQQDRPLLVIASNRGPFTFREKEGGAFEPVRGSGGLVTALGALAESHEVLWVASATGEGDRRWAETRTRQVEQVEGIYLQLLTPERSAYDQYYNVIANPLLWFIQHQLWDIPRAPSITEETWQAWEQGYLAVNKLFADAIATRLEKTDRPAIVFPQDYQLYLLPRFLRERVGDRVQIQPFIHIPWPGPDAWRILPNTIRDEILSSLLTADRVGFQTKKDAFNFVQTCRFYLPNAHSRGSRDSIHIDGREVKARAYPISVDVDKVQDLVDEPQTQLLKSQLINAIGDHQLILRVDRIEPSKNILRGLKAYQTLLQAHPEHRGRVLMLALLVPSRMEVEQYQDYLRDIMAEAGLINAEYSERFWEPVRIMVGDNYSRAIAAMQLYDVLLVNPLADGMNLVAKEGVLVNQRNGVLILSEHAGAFYELGDQALTVSPFDIYGTAEAMHRALTLPYDERQQRAAILCDKVRYAGVKQWFSDQVDDAFRALQAGRLDGDPVPGDVSTAIGGG